MCLVEGALAVLLWKAVVDVSIHSFPSNHIDVGVVWERVGWHFTGFLGNPVASRRWESWELLRRVHNEDESPWLVGGDLNEVVWDSEKFGGKESKKLATFREVLDCCNLMELDGGSDTFTWCNRRKDREQIW